MDQGWKRLPLLVIFLLFWRSADGFRGRAHSSAYNPWGLPPDVLSPREVQSSMSEARVTGTLPVEEVGSSLFPSSPVKSGSKFNLNQFVKGASISSQPTSHTQTAPSSSVSASLPLPVSAQPSSNLTSSGSTFQGAASGVSLQTQYAASGSGPVVSTQGESSSYPATLVSGQSTSDSLPVSSSLETSGLQSAGASLPVFSLGSITHNSSSALGATSIFPSKTSSQSSPSLLMAGPQSSSGSKSTGAASSLYSQGSGSYSSLSSQALGSATSQSSSGAELSPSSLHSIPAQVGTDSYSSVPQSLSASSLYTPVSLSNKLDALPLEVSSQSTSGQSSPSVSVSSTQLATSSSYVPAQGGSNSPSLSPGTLSVPMSAPQAIYSQSTGSGSSYSAVSRFGSLSQTGASGQFASQGGNYYVKPISSPQSASSQASSVLSSRKQYTSAAQFGASTGFASQGMSSSYSGSVPSQGTTSQFSPGADSLSTTVQGSRKPFVSSYGTQSGSSAPFTLQGSLAYAASPQAQGTASQFAPGYASGSLSSPQTFVGPTAVQSSQKQFMSTFTSSSGTQAGSSTRFTLQGSTAYGGSQPQDTSQFVPGCQPSYAGVSLSSPQAGPSTAVQGSLKQPTSTYMGSSGTQAGSSTLFTLQKSTAYGSPQSQGTTSQFAPGSQSSYAGVSLSSPQAVAGPTAVQSSRKQFTSASQGSSGAQFGAATGFASEGVSSRYSGSVQSQGTASQFAPGYASGSLSSPQAVVGPTTVQSSRKQFTSTYMGSSGTQAGSSTLSALQGSTTYGGSQPQSTASQFAPGSSTYASVSLSSPQAVAGPTAVQSSRKQFTSASQGSSGAQFGASTGFASQGISSFYSGSVQSQGTASQFAPGYTGVSLSSPQAVAGPTTVQSSRKQFTSAFTGSSGAQFGAATGFASQGMSSRYSGSVQSQGTASPFAPGYAGVSLSSPQTDPSTNVLGFQKLPTSTYMGSSGTQAGSSTRFTLQKSTAYGSPQSQGTTSHFGSQPSYAGVSLSSPQPGPSTAVQGSLKQPTSTYMGSSGTQAGSSTLFTLQGSTAYGGSPQPQDAASEFASGSPTPYASVSLSSPQAVAGPTTVQSSRKQFTSTYMGSSGTQAGSSTLSALQGSTTYGGSQPQSTASQFAPGSSTYASVSLSSPQAVAGPTTVQSSRKQFTSAFTGSSGAPFGAATGFASEGVSSRYSGSVQSQGTASQFAPGYASGSLSSPQAVAGPTAVQSSRKQFTSASQGSSGAQFGASTGFASQGMSSRYSGSVQSQGTASQFAPGYAGVSLSSPQADPSTNVLGFQKLPTSTYMGSSGTQAGSSTRFTLQKSTAYGSPQSQGTTSHFGSQPSYAGVSLSSPQPGPSTAVQGSLKQPTSTYMGSSGTQAGSSTLLALQGSTTYGGSQPQSTPSQFAPGSSPYASVSLSSPQVVAGPTTVQSSRKQFASTFTSSSGPQTGSSTLFTLQGSTAYGGSPQPQDAASEFASGSPTPYASVSLSSPQGVAGQSSQAYQRYSVSQSQKSQRWKPSATHWVQGVKISDAAASQGSSSQSSPMPFSSISSAGGSSSGVSGQFVSAQGGGTSYGGSFRSQSLSTKYIPGSQLYDPNVASQGTSSPSASAFLSGYNSMYNQNAPAQPSYSSSSSRFYSSKLLRNADVFQN